MLYSAFAEKDDDGIYVYLYTSNEQIATKVLEVKNILTDGGKNLAQYPIGIYKKGVMFIFTFIINTTELARRFL